jgi:hypothetical protein
LIKIIPFYFLVALGIGFFLVYIYHPTPKVVYEYPSPEKIKDITYQNKSNQCYKYHTSKVNCPLDSTKIIDITN